jgi:diguanylate cyclase (GGDEF)-like protein/excisionase family DNA binding protein
LQVSERADSDGPRADLEPAAARQWALAELGRRAIVEDDASQLIELAVDLAQVLRGGAATALLEIDREAESVRVAAHRPGSAGPARSGLEETSASELLRLVPGRGSVVLRGASQPGEWQRQTACATLTMVGACHDRMTRILISLHATDRVFISEEITFLDSLTHIVSARIARRDWEEDLRCRAFHNPLTELPNRFLFLDRVRHALERAAGKMSLVAVLYVGLDSRLATAVADDALRTVAVRLRRAIRKDDTLAHLERDAFAVLSEEFVRERGAPAQAERLYEMLRLIEVEARQVDLAPRIGIATSSEPPSTAETLLSDARAAMQRAREHEAGVELFDERLRLAMAERPTVGQGPRAQPKADGDEESGPMVGVTEAGEILGVSQSTIRRWADRGRIKVFRTTGGHRRVPVAEVRRMSAALAGTDSPLMREVPLPSQKLTELADVVEARGYPLVHVASRALYEPNRFGWFAVDGSRDILCDWLTEFGHHVRAGEWASALDATRRLLVRADQGGASLAEQFGFLERLSEVIVRTLQHDGAEKRVVLDTRRLFRNLSRVALSEGGRDRPRPGSSSGPA